MTNYRVRKLIAGIVAALAVFGTAAVTAAPAEAKARTSVQRVNGI